MVSRISFVNLLLITVGIYYAKFYGAAGTEEPREEVNVEEEGKETEEQELLEQKRSYMKHLEENLSRLNESLNLFANSAITVTGCPVVDRELREMRKRDIESSKIEIKKIEMRIRRRIRRIPQLKSKSEVLGADEERRTMFYSEYFNLRKAYLMRTLESKLYAYNSSIVRDITIGSENIVAVIQRMIGRLSEINTMIDLSRSQSVLDRMAILEPHLFQEALSRAMRAERIAQIQGLGISVWNSVSRCCIL